MSPTSASPSARTRLAILFLTVFVDLVGFGIVLPLLPFYADRFGASGLTIGFLVTSYSLAQLFLAPLWGRLSDRHGRRPVLLVGLVGSAISYVVFAYAGSLLTLFVSRIMAGVGGANVPVAQAYIADVTPPERRAGNMGLIGAAFGLGFIFGPALGGLLAPISSEAPGLAAAGLCFGNAVLAFFLLPESLPSGVRRGQEGEPGRAREPGPGAHAGRGASVPPPDARSAVPVRLRDLRVALGSTEVLRILFLSFFFTVAFSAMQPTFPLFGEIRFDLTERTVGYLFAFLGLVSAIMQGGLVRKLVPRLGEAMLIRLCALPFVAGLLVLGLAPDIPWLLVGLTLLGVGFGGTLPSIHSLLSRVAPGELQGSILGVGQSVGALARVVGPVLAGWTFDALGIAWPYLAGAGIGCIAFLGAFGIHQPDDGVGETSSDAGPTATPLAAP